MKKKLKKRIKKLEDQNARLIEKTDKDREAIIALCKLVKDNNKLLTLHLLDKHDREIIDYFTKLWSVKIEINSVCASSTISIADEQPKRLEEPNE